MLFSAAALAESGPPDANAGQNKSTEQETSNAHTPESAASVSAKIPDQAPADATVDTNIDTKVDTTADTKLPEGLAKELSQLKPQKESSGKSSGSSYLEMVVGLMAVLGVIVAMAWLARRFNVTGMSVNPSSLKLQSVLSLGTKEKVVIVNVEGRRFMLGVTPQQISLLSELDETSEPTEGKSLLNTPSFAQQIKKALTQGKLGEDTNAS